MRRPLADGWLTMTSLSEGDRSRLTHVAGDTTRAADRELESKTHMPNHRRVVLVGFASLLCWSTISSSCNRCYTTGTIEQQICRQSGAFTVNAAPTFVLSCAPAFEWVGILGQSRLTIQRGCATDDQLWVIVSFPHGVADATFSLPSPEVSFYAELAPAVSSPRGDPNPRPHFNTSDASLEVSSGSVVVHSIINYGASVNQENYGIDANIDIHLRATTGEEFSIAGQVVESDCIVRTTPYCQGD